MSIKFQFHGYLVECETPDEAIAIMSQGGKTPAPLTTKPNRVKPGRSTVGQDRYRGFINDLSDNLKKVVVAIGGQAQISMNDLAKIVGTQNNMSLSAWITTAVRVAQKRDIQPEQLWEKTGERGSAKFTPTPALRTAVEGLREPRLSAVKQTA